MTLNKPIYFDYMATTPLDPYIKEKMLACMDEINYFGNPSSQHFYGLEAASLIDQARSQVAALINADSREIIWTSSATEADNLALKGAAMFYARKGKHIITMATEHKAVLDTCAFLATQGFEITYLQPEKNGLLDLSKLESALRADTILVSIMFVNNETGVIQDIAKIGALLKNRGIIFHVDAAQAAGKISIDVKLLNVDLMSFSAHKIYGPKGIGALYLRQQPRIRLIPLIHGGGQERGMRSSTLATHQIVGMGYAFALAKQYLQEEQKRILHLRENLWQGLKAIGGVFLNGDTQAHIAGCLNVYFDGVEGESLLVSLHQLALATGSACNSTNPDPSHVLLAMGLTRDQAQRSIRISFGRFTTLQEIDEAVKQIQKQVERLRDMSPLWKKKLSPKFL